MKPWVIKLGGAALSNPEAVVNLAEAILLLKQEGHHVVVVHGGGPNINQRLTEKKITWSFHEGQRITTPEMMGVIADALGDVNNMICDVLKSKGLNAIGLKGHEHQMFFCKQMNPELGQVGEVMKVNTHSIEDALSMNLVPVISPVGIDEAGLTYNINADFGASSVAQKLEAKILIYATDQRGILDLNELPYDSLTLCQLKILMEKGGVTGGMLAKSRSIEKALVMGVGKVCVTHALELKELIEKKRGGTLCVEMSRLDFVMKSKVKEAYDAVS